MCFRVQPVCNACKASAKPLELHECIFRDCKYIEERTRFLSCYELPNWDCNTQDCGLNMKTIDDEITELDRLLRMEGSLDLEPAAGDSLGSRDNEGGEAGTGEASEEQGLANTASTLASGTHTLEMKKSQIEKFNAGPRVREPKTGSERRGFDGIGTSPPRATESATKDNVIPNDGASNSNAKTKFDLNTIDLENFPRCKSCFKDRRRCNGQSPCDKCKQRGSPKACRPVTLSLLKTFRARAKRVLENAKKEQASA
ncbi:hypothetical protein Daus18300_002197 [Diaporthe australafricana]|uniref:Zn(2)-C6 fungal-type domain-containing protein n=1 Tax=Diaporthe australafricana TaxID=127596 RepID=A0ABR3XRB2_9PEZI